MKKNIFFLCIAILFSLPQQACVAMDDSKLNVGKKSFVEGDYHRAFTYLEPAAKNGNADAEYAVGYMYFYGLGTVQNKEQAMRWMQRAANQGQLQAQRAITMIRGEDFSTMQTATTITEPTAMMPMTQQVHRIPPADKIKHEYIMEQELIPNTPPSNPQAIGTPVTDAKQTIQPVAP